MLAEHLVYQRKHELGAVVDHGAAERTGGRLPGCLRLVQSFPKKFPPNALKFRALYSMLGVLKDLPATAFSGSSSGQGQ